MRMILRKGKVLINENRLIRQNENNYYKGRFMLLFVLD